MSSNNDEEGRLTGWLHRLFALLLYLMLNGRCGLSQSTDGFLVLLLHYRFLNSVDAHGSGSRDRRGRRR